MEMTFRDRQDYKYLISIEISIISRAGYITGPPDCTDLCHSCSTSSPCATGCTCNMGCCDCGGEATTIPS